jgi:aspartyl protease family protein
MKIRNLFVVCATCLLSVSLPLAAAEKLSLQALFKDKAIILIDGARRVLKTGDTSPEGVKLIATDTQEEKAEVEVDGKRQELKLGVVISSFVSTGKGKVTLFAERGGHYFADGSINGAPIRFMVDTGATTIAMNSATARRIGIDYQRTGRPGAANTAGGMVRAYYLKLERVQVGDITLYGVDAGVIEGDFPTEALLGNSFLGRLDMKRDDQKLEISER